MSSSDKSTESNRILDAIRAKRERRSSGRDIAEVEAELLADLESFDLGAAEEQARRDHLGIAGGMATAALAFPEILPEGAARQQGARGSFGSPGATPATPGGLLGELRQRAEVRQHELHSEFAERSATNLAIDNALRYLFYYLHDLIQQLNIVKPEIPRRYSVGAEFTICDLVWQEGFSDYRTQSQSAGALIELVTCSCQLASPHSFDVVRDGPAVDRFRHTIFDYGLQFDCKEFRNERAYVERAEFSIRGQIAVSARWKADFEKGVVLLEARNLERLGSSVMPVRPAAFDQALLDEFGRLLIGQPNNFRELARR
jgi:hypothetical protein